MSKQMITMEQLLNIYLENKNKLSPNSSPEIEAKFGTRGIKTITKINVDNVIQQLLFKDFTFNEESKYYLRIQL